MTNPHLNRKGARGASKVAENIELQLREQLTKISWRYAPRAKVAVRMHFHSKKQQIPDLHNLVKFYLDPLRSVVFDDDRQVDYLVAECWRLPKAYQSLSTLDSYVFIEVERLADLKQTLRLYDSLTRESEFKRFLRDSYDHRKLIPDEDDNNYFDEMFDIGDLLLSIKKLKASGLISNVIDSNLEQLEEFNKEMLGTERTQERLLKFSRLGRFDRPDSLGSKKFTQILHMEPLTISLGDLPSIGGSDEYKQRIRDRIRQLGKKDKFFTQVVVPIELDVQVSPKALLLGKDLDNIMRDIAPAINEQLLQGDAYIHGYRIYMTKNTLHSDTEGNIRIKLLPRGSISDFEDMISKTLEAGEHWLEEQLR